jgi:hypothetical protein
MASNMMYDTGMATIDIPLPLTFSKRHTKMQIDAELNSASNGASHFVIAYLDHSCRGCLFITHVCSCTSVASFLSLATNVPQAPQQNNGHHSMQN